MTYALKLFALLFSTGFSAGLLVTTFVFVPGWYDLEPAKAVAWFSKHGLTLGIVMLPMGVLALLFFLIVAIASIRKKGLNFESAIWLLAALAAFGSIILLASYFSSANLLFFENSIEPSQVHSEITSWGYWNWIRTILSLLATTFAFIGLVMGKVALEMRCPPCNS